MCGLWWCLLEGRSFAQALGLGGRHLPDLTSGDHHLQKQAFRIYSSLGPDTPPSTRGGLAAAYISHAAGMRRHDARAGCLKRCALCCSVGFIVINNGEATERGTGSINK